MTGSSCSATAPPAKPRSYFSRRKKQCPEFLSIAKLSGLIYTRPMDDTKHYPGRLRAPPAESEVAAPPRPAAGEAESAPIRHLGPQIPNLRKPPGITPPPLAAPRRPPVPY